jgi:pilus assembly protein CpaE
LSQQRIKVLVADDMVELRSNVRRMLGNQENIIVIGEAGDGEETLKMAKDLTPHVILMDINMPKQDGMKVTESLAKDHPEIQVVMMSVQSEQEYFRRAMKAGAKDFLTKPFSGSDLIDTIQNVFNKWVKDRPDFLKSQQKAQIITFFSTKGGVGKTTLAANLAVSLAGRGKRTLLIDCSLQFGDIAIMLNEKVNRNIFYIVERDEEISYLSIEKNLTSHPSGLKLLLAPSEPAYAEAVKPHHIKQIIDQVSPMYQYIIIDTAPHIGEVELGIFDRTDTLLLVATLEISSLKNTKLCLKTLADINFDTSKIKLLLNKETANVGIDRQGIEEGLKIPMFASVPMDSETSQLSLNQGEPFVVKFPHSLLTRAIENLGNKFTGEDKRPAVPEKKGSAILRIRDLLFGSSN